MKTVQLAIVSAILLLSATASARKAREARLVVCEHWTMAAQQSGTPPQAVCNDSETNPFVVNAPHVVLVPMPSGDPIKVIVGWR